MMGRQLRHIHIESGVLSLDYQAPAEQAQRIADELAQISPEIAVTVDDDVRSNFPPLPCTGLWE